MSTFDGCLVALSRIPSLRTTWRVSVLRVSFQLFHWIQVAAPSDVLITGCGLAAAGAPPPVSAPRLTKAHSGSRNGPFRQYLQSSGLRVQETPRPLLQQP